MQDEGITVDMSERRTSGYLAARPSIEGGKIGIGIGGIAMADGLVATGFLRVGNRDKLHAFFDFAPLDAPIGTTGIVQLGLGYNNGFGRGAGGSAGFAGCSSFCWDAGEGGGLFVKGHIPITERIDATFGLARVQAPVSAHSGIAVGARARLK